MDKIVEDLEDVAWCYSKKILHWDTKKLRGKIGSGLVPVKDKNGTTTSKKERFKKRWAEHFENVLKRDKFMGNAEERWKSFDPLRGKENWFCEEELETALKRWKNKCWQYGKWVFKYGVVWLEINYKLLEIMNRSSEKGEVNNDLRKL